MNKAKFYQLVTKLRLMDESQDCSDSTINTAILSAFEVLPENEKIEILEFAAGHSDEADVDAINKIIAKISENGASSIEHANQLELIRLKSWVVKTSVILIGISFIAFVGIMIVVNGADSASDMNTYFDDFIKIMNLIVLNKS